jgi:hypothetical protein
MSLLLMSVGDGSGVVSCLRPLTFGGRDGFELEAAAVGVADALRATMEGGDVHCELARMEPDGEAEDNGRPCPCMLTRTR